MIWHNEKRIVKDLKPVDWNPRKISDEQLTQLKQSIEKFNLVEIPAINTNGNIISGHQRIKALILLGRGNEEIDVRLPDKELSLEEEQELNIRANKNTGEFDFDLLANFDDSLLKEIGFSSMELDKIFSIGNDEKDDLVPEEPKEAKSKLGDLYILGNHRILCGDSTKIEDVEKLMDGKKANLVFTDPPYGMKLNADFSDMKGIAGGNKYDNVIGDDIDYNPEHIFRDFGYCKEIFLWGADYYAERIPKRNEGCFEVWDKTESGISPNSAYEKQFGSNFELCWSKTKHKRQVFPCLWKGIFGLSQEDVKKRLHPTQKPVKLLEMFLKQFSDRDNLVVDLFLGSGSTLIACEKTNRICYGCEIDPKYIDVIVQRYVDFSGNHEIIKNGEKMTWQPIKHI